MSVKPKQKYILPSQRILNMIRENNEAGHPMTPVDISVVTSFAILDKLDEVSLILRSFMPRIAAPAPAKKETEK